MSPLSCLLAFHSFDENFGKKIFLQDNINATAECEIT
jgi:hypothetical protein